MPTRSNAQAAMISLLCGVVFTASVAVAQTSSSGTSTQTNSSDTGVKAMQAQKSTSAMNSDDFLDGLTNLPTQSKAGFNPKVGAKVPDDVTLHPMPSVAAKALPGVKDHHVAKMDGNTAVIADPNTREIMHVISGDSTASTSGSSKTGSAGNASGTKDASSKGNGTTTTSGSSDTGSTSTGSGSNGSK